MYTVSKKPLLMSITSRDLLQYCYYPVYITNQQNSHEVLSRLFIYLMCVRPEKKFQLHARFSFTVVLSYYIILSFDI